MHSPVTLSHTDLHDPLKRGLIEREFARLFRSETPEAGMAWLAAEEWLLDRGFCTRVLSAPFADWPWVKGHGSDTVFARRVETGDTVRIEFTTTERSPS